MKINAKVNCSAKSYRVSFEDDLLTIHMPVKPIDGKANQKVIELVADHFGVPKSKVKIVLGLKSSQKTIEILS